MRWLLIVQLVILIKVITAYRHFENDIHRSRPLFVEDDDDELMKSLRSDVDDAKEIAQRDLGAQGKVVEAAIKGLKANIVDVRGVLKTLQLPKLKGTSTKEASRIIARWINLFKKLQASPFFKIKPLPGASRYETSISRFPAKYSKILAMLTGCRPILATPDCSKISRKFRTPNGVCNNRNRPLHGAALTMMNRLIKPRYGNGFNSPRNGGLPSARAVSKILVNGKIKESKDVTDILKTVGQFLDHDMALTPHASSSVCKNCQPSDFCFPILVPKNDNRLKTKKCLDFGRSFPVCGTGTTSIFYPNIAPRENMNEITSFVDASNIYGSSAKTLKALRDPDTKSGKLRVFKCSRGVSYLPFEKTFSDACKSDVGCTPSFFAGDVRSNENPQLLSMHTIWVRYHNRIADQLKRVNPHWNGERIFQESRKITGAIWQKIVFRDYLTVVTGRKLRYWKYNPTVDPSMANSFATSTFRFGHTQIKPIIERLTENLKPVPGGNVELAKVFNSPTSLTEVGGTDPIMRGLYAVDGKGINSNEVIASVIRDELFANTQSIPGDLAALNIQRGRDHGIPSYLHFRRLCHLKGNNFASFKNIDTRAKNRLRRIYVTPKKIDLWVGSIMETKIKGAQVGHTLRCLLEKQFSKLQKGDRHFYTNRGEFRKSQVKEIEKINLAKVICDTGEGIYNIPRNVFRVTKQKDFVKCCSLPDINLDLWKERKG